MKYIKIWLQAVAVGHVVGGVLLPFLLESEIVFPYMDSLNTAFGVTNVNGKNQAVYLMGLFGPTIASWGILFWFVVQQQFTKPTKNGWWGMVAAVLVWAPYDSVLSIYYCVYLNVIINGISALMVLIPLWWCRHKFGYLNAKGLKTKGKKKTKKKRHVHG